jgi:predicted permease
MFPHRFGPGEIRPGVARLFRLAARRPGAERDEVDDEIRLHLQLRAAQLAHDEGLAPAAARAEAERRFGPLDEARERLHASARRREDRMRLREWWHGLGHDLRLAARGLRRAPGFASVVVLTLALGIGANTAVFSLVNAVLLRALPVRDPGALVRLEQRLPEAERTAKTVTNPLWEALRDALEAPTFAAPMSGRQGAFAGLAAFGDARFNLADAGEERRADGLWVNGDYFATLGVRPALGRTLTRADDVRGCPAVAVVSHAFWRTTLAGDPAAVGRTLRLDGRPVPVVGVLDPRFTGLEVGKAPAVYVPVCADAALHGAASFLDQRSTWVLRVVGRPRPGLALDQVNAHLAAASSAVFRATLPPDWGADMRRQYLGRSLVADRSLGELSGLRRAYARPLTVLSGVAGLVLLLTCANVANLVLARAAGRRRELTVRAALGAGRARLSRWPLVEGLVLAGAGAALGLALATWGSRLLVRLLSTAREPVALDVSPDGRVLAFTAAAAVGTAVLFSLTPAWQATRVDPQHALQAHGRGVVGRPGRFGAARALVAAQVALSLVLVAGAALLLGSFRALTTLDPGFRSAGVLVARAELRLAPEARGRSAEVVRQVVDGLRALPGVRHAAAAYTTPVSNNTWNGTVQVDGAPQATFESNPVYFNRVTDGYFASLGMRLLAGRDFSGRDGPNAPPVAVVNETLARRFFPGRSPVGRTFRLPDGDGFGLPVEIIGVVRDTKYESLRDEAPATAFFAMAQEPATAPEVSFTVQSAGPVGAVAAVVPRVFRDVAPRAVLRVMAMDRQMAESLARDRLLAALSTAFGALALLLAAVGLYGTLSHMVARRRAELAVRVALGAAPGRVLGAVFGEVGRMVGAGLAVGALGTLATTRLVAGLLYGVGPRDPALLGGAALLLAAAAALAGYLPARRAARADPVRALRDG